MNNTEFYDRLGVSKDASQAEIKKAYRKMSKKYHPDINKEPGAEEKYKEIQEAYETLGDEQKRAAYDQYGPAGANGGFGGGAGGFGGFDGAGFGGFEDIFSSFFGGGGGMRNPNAPRQGDDLQYRVNLTFEEAVFGVEKEVVYNRESTCSTCHGSGAKPGTSPVTCSRCHGSGVINVDTQTPLGMMRRQVTCDVCHGKGKEIKEPCHTCHGTGHEKKTHKVSVKIPAGVETGQQIRLQGQGEAGFNGGPYGDLFVIINVLPSNKFERNGSTIYYTMNISFVQAALGDTVEVPTVHGDVEMTIPAGTQTGKTFRLRGKGAPKLHGGGQGDQHVTVNIVTPTKLNDAQVKALKQFAQAGGDKVGNPKKKGFFDKVKDAFDGE
ncbi:heat-shock protein DnaJ [Streptococcus infantarius subsp. infantarius]|uniref:molecular chaperone DnaJ n=1 Tax=Streptococcus infantarius TaxID=102684 RepID=UPI001BDA2BA8|nr:molecular chaperone DnaJ [Streptococcus infantarius]MBT0897142.1 molecular chaperone DnaJ [Streptococcus infantarius subsp. infantarius]MBT0900839.1 molecular chaperone DnaJ [Streptococcus infantarius subsp. infantarius]MBT1034681.1 molecular chaperone DnaJ [Streptococcus infantarius subsp. infantarius]MCO4475300.1 heat-shock protein DnaJ [Streptococcus infantarius subsp. infantarius]MCO4488926.1 heat-shock protein DnaJ [Streptococcus infantarius subsp. infantarius]